MEAGQTMVMVVFNEARDSSSVVIEASWEPSDFAAGLPRKSRLQLLLHIGTLLERFDI